MLHRFLHNKTAVGTVSLVLIVALMGIFAPVIAPHDPYATDILNKFAHFSKEYPLGTDNLGRCILSRMVYGIRPTLGLAVLTMLGTIGLGALMGLLAGYFRGITEELIMRVVDVMLSFPSQIMVFAVVALLGINVQNVILANVFIKWAWYARMIPERRDGMDEILYGAGKEVYESNRRAFLTANGTRMELLREQIMVYFVFGYFCGAVYNDNPYGKLKLAVAATILVEELLMAEWLREDLPEKKIVDLVHCFSREVEHSDENRGLLEDELVKREEFRLKALLAAVIEWKRA